VGLVEAIGRQIREARRELGVTIAAARGRSASCGAYGTAQTPGAAIEAARSPAEITSEYGSPRAASISAAKIRG
jgi:hypothetical protein